MTPMQTRLAAYASYNQVVLSNQSTTQAKFQKEAQSKLTPQEMQAIQKAVHSGGTSLAVNFFSAAEKLIGAAIAVFLGWPVAKAIVGVISDSHLERLATVIASDVRILKWVSKIEHKDMALTEWFTAYTEIVFSVLYSNLAKILTKYELVRTGNSIEDAAKTVREGVNGIIGDLTKDPKLLDAATRVGNDPSIQSGIKALSKGIQDLGLF